MGGEMIVRIVTSPLPSIVYYKSPKEGSESINTELLLLVVVVIVVVMVCEYDWNRCGYHIMLNKVRLYKTCDCYQLLVKKANHVDLAEQ